MTQKRLSPASTHPSLVLQRQTVRIYSVPVRSGIQAGGGNGGNATTKTTTTTGSLSSGVCGGCKNSIR
jgi:hypothetical protein